ncbi:MAG TPA: hypothetical protein VK171_08785, partial [Fimbriimonas sp.]|nr:hypothetical protein [Fimbriimonas sp.]
NSFNYIDRVQSEDRAHRIGQTRSVLYVDLVTEGTIDEVVVEALKCKQDVSEYVRTRIDEVKRSFLDE